MKYKCLILEHLINAYKTWSANIILHHVGQKPHVDLHYLSSSSFCHSWITQVSRFHTKIGYLKANVPKIKNNLSTGLFYTFVLCEDFLEDQLAVKKLQSSVAAVYFVAQVAQQPHNETSTAVQLMLIGRTSVHQLRSYPTKHNCNTILN